MERKCCQLILLLLLLMAVISPLLQLDSWDRFPVSSDDIECQVTCCLCSIGMLLSFAAMLKLVQVLRRVVGPVLFGPTPETSSQHQDLIFEPKLSPPHLIPLRI